MPSYRIENYFLRRTHLQLDLFLSFHQEDLAEWLRSFSRHNLRSCSRRFHTAPMRNRLGGPCSRSRELGPRSIFQTKNRTKNEKGKFKNSTNHSQDFIGGGGLDKLFVESETFKSETHILNKKVLSKF